MSDNADDMNDLVLLAMARDEAVSKVKELEAKLEEEIQISNKRGNMIEFDLLPKLHEAEAVLRDVDAWVDNLGLYAQEGHEPVAVFKRVKEVLSSE